MRLAYVITHPDVVIDPAVPVPQWPLSERGRRRMRKLLEPSWMGNVGAIVCSTERKAIDGARILAGGVGIGYEMIEGLGEIDRSSTGYLPQEEHATAARQVFAHPERSIRGWETACDAQRRMGEAIEAAIRGSQGQGDLALVAYGGVATFYLCHLKGCPIRWEERQPGRTGGNYLYIDSPSESGLGPRTCLRLLLRGCVEGSRPRLAGD